MTDRKPPTKSYMIGIIALSFLLIGYQAALFIHRAAVTSITSVRDHPDTVYIIEKQILNASLSSADSRPSSHPVTRTVRKNASHSKVAEAVRKKAPHKKVETFSFNPNTVTVEELCRLGFSVRQAESIDNYRKKGGRFNRKADFAKSYVVSDSVYKRLEPFIEIPLLDINIADSSDFEALPGIGAFYASAMIRHRKALGSYSDTKQLMDIRGFSQERYDALKDLVTVSASSIVPYPLWSLPADSLKKHPYIKTAAVARAIVLYRENNPLDRLTVRGLREAGVINEETFAKLSLCKIGHAPVNSSGT